MIIKQVNLKCPNGHRLVSYGTVSLTYKNGSKHVIPMYRCSYCSQKYVNTNLVDKGKKLISTNGHRIINLYDMEPKTKKTGAKKVDTKIIESNGEPLAVYVAKQGEKKPKTCYQCNKKLSMFWYRIKKPGKNKKLVLMGAICSDCKTKYFDFNLYNQHKYAFTPINQLSENENMPIHLLKVTGEQMALNEISSTIELDEAAVESTESTGLSENQEIYQKLDSEQIKEDRESFQVYIRLSNSKNACENCQGILIPSTQNFCFDDKKPRSIACKKCVKCGTKYLSYGSYNTIKQYNLDVINASELDHLKLEYTQKQEAKRQRKELQKAKQRQKAMDDNRRQLHNNYHATNSINNDLYQRSYPTEPKISEAPRYYNYCMCELKNISTGEIFKVTVNNSSSVNRSDSSNQIYPVGTEMADECLKAAANDWDKIHVKGVEYRVLRHVRYDAVYVDQYIEPVRKTETLERNKPGAKTTQSYQYQGTVDARSDVKDVYVYFKLQSCRCIQQKHKIGSVTMKTHSITCSKDVNINAYYCSDCKRYFVNNDAIRSLLLKHTCPLVRFHIVQDFTGQLNPESELKMYGYTVQEGVLSEQQRHDLLAVLIDKDLMSKTSIIKCIQFNIEFVGKRANMENAKERWRNDIQFVSQYVVGNKKKINGRLVR